MIEYGDVQLRLIDGYNIEKSSQTVTFSNIKADFTNKTALDLPKKYQECKIIIDGKVKFLGYINGYSFSPIRLVDKYMEIEIEILSPMSMTTRRTQIITGNYKLTNLITKAFEPLIDDGFEIVELNVTERTINVNYVCETIEYIMSDLSNKYNIWWFIDENKKIYIKDVSLLLKQEAKYQFSEDKKIAGLQYIKPTIGTQDYANVVNFKNVRIYELSRQEFDGNSHNPLISEQISNITNDKEIEFNYPVDISHSNILRSANSQSIEGLYIYGLYISGTYTDNTTFKLYIMYDTTNDTWTTTNNIGFDGESESEEEFLLQRDSFFSNLITGFKYNGSKTLSSITNIKSDSALIWNVNKFYNDKGIKDKAGVISDTGIIETTIDMNEQWKTIPELLDIGASYIEKTDITLDSQLELKLDKDILNVGDKIYINKMLFDSDYIVTSVKENNSKQVSKYDVICKNQNIVDNYIDLFRTPTAQENEDKIYHTYITHYTQEGIKETYEVVR